MVKKAMALLQDESNLLEIARLVGAESLSPEDQLILHTSRSLREDFLHQNAFHPVDTFASIRKQQLMLGTILLTHDEMLRAVKADVSPRVIFDFPLTEDIAKMRYLPEEQIEQISDLQKKITEAVNEKIRSENA